MLKNRYQLFNFFQSYTGWLVFLLLMLGLQNVNAQAEQKKLNALTNVYNYAGITILKMSDPYLSLLEYSGIGGRCEFAASRFFNPENPQMASFARFSGIAARTVNPRSTASVTWIGANASWGVQYYYRQFEDILLLGGANLDVDFAYKMNSRNVNNPVNIDLATNLNLMLGGRYYIHTKKRILQLNAGFEFPMMGCMFVPYPGFSYYEMYSTKGYMEAVHFSSLHNKQGLKQFFSIDIPFKHSTWTLGVRKHDLKYKADGQVYSYSDFTYMAGFTYDLIEFSGRKPNIPDSFISPRY